MSEVNSAGDAGNTGNTMGTSDTGDTGSIVSAFATLKEAEFAVRALVEIGRFDQETLSVVAGLSRPDYRTEVETYFVMLTGPLASVHRAQTFLQGPVSSSADRDAAFQHEAKQGAILMSIHGRPVG